MSRYTDLDYYEYILSPPVFVSLWKHVNPNTYFEIVTDPNPHIADPYRIRRLKTDILIAYRLLGH